MTDVQGELDAIRERNKRVETDKAWEKSWTRRVFIASITYLFAGIYMSVVGLPHAWIGAIVPTSGYLLSTLSLPFIREFWRTKMHKN